jgi:hypothetical protein
MRINYKARTDSPAQQTTRTSKTGATDPITPAAAKSQRWLARIGVLGLLFFFVKGLVWIGVAALASWGLLAR